MYVIVFVCVFAVNAESNVIFGSVYFGVKKR